MIYPGTMRPSRDRSDTVEKEFKRVPGNGSGPPKGAAAERVALMIETLDNARRDVLSAAREAAPAARAGDAVGPASRAGARSRTAASANAARGPSSVEDDVRSALAELRSGARGAATFATSPRRGPGKRASRIPTTFFRSRGRARSIRIRRKVSARSSLCSRAALTGTLLPPSFTRTLRATFASAWSGPGGPARACACFAATITRRAI